MMFLTKYGCVFLSRTAQPTLQAIINYAVCDLGKYGMMTFSLFASEL
jgi:hypothetical protein